MAEWKPGLGPDGQYYAYGICIDCTKNQESVEMFEKMNERSRRHYHMTEEQCKDDDYFDAYQSALRIREEERVKERSKYVNHRVEV